MSKRIGIGPQASTRAAGRSRKPARNTGALASILGVEELGPRVADRLLSYVGVRQRLSRERNPTRRAALDRQASVLREKLLFDADRLERVVRVLGDMPGELAHVTIVPPAVKARDIDLKAVRRAAREFFMKNPRALERNQS